MTEELKPCPFCGSDEVSVHHDADQDAYWIACVCNATMTAQENDDDKHVKSAWNRRAASSVANGAADVELPRYRLHEHCPGAVSHKEGEFYKVEDVRAAIAALDKPVVAMTEETIDEVIAAMGWDLDPVERNDIGQFARAILAAVGPNAGLVEDAARWQFMMRIADDEDGPESNAMESLRIANEMMDNDRLASVQMVEMVDQARATLAAHAGQGAKA